MAALTWDNLENRAFEAGVEKVALYVGGEGAKGVAWNGITAITQNPITREGADRYQDGVRLRHDKVPNDYETELTAFTYPDEFNHCLGIVEGRPGFYVQEQIPQTFGLVYQTKLGNAAKSDYTHNKIHIIYNAIATPNPVSRTTIGPELELTSFSWGIKTYAAPARGFRPASHFIIDPSEMGPLQYQYIYDRLYGTSSITPRLLYPNVILDIIDNWRALYPSPNTFPSLETIPGGP